MELLKLKAVVVGNTVLLMDMVSTAHGKEWVEISRVDRPDRSYDYSDSDIEDRIEKKLNAASGWKSFKSYSSEEEELLKDKTVTVHVNTDHVTGASTAGERSHWVGEERPELIFPTREGFTATSEETDKLFKTIKDTGEFKSSFSFKEDEDNSAGETKDNE